MTMPFRFGLVAMPRSRPDWLGFAQRVEDLGFDALLVPDNLDGVAPFVACAAAAAVTTSLVVGPYVLATPLRTPGSRWQRRARGCSSWPGAPRTWSPWAPPLSPMSRNWCAWPASRLVPRGTVPTVWH